MSAKGHGPQAADIRRECSLLPLVPQDPPPKRSSPRRWMARCPFHEDSRPSMAVFIGDDRWHYHCFACGEKGSVITFVMKVERCSFRDALRKLAGSEVRAAVPLWVPPKRPEVTFPCQTAGCSRVIRVPLVDLWTCDLSHPSWEWVGEGLERRGTCYACVLKQAQEARAA